MTRTTRRTLIGGASAAAVTVLVSRFSASAQQATPIASPTAIVRDWASEHWVGAWATAPAGPWLPSEEFPDPLIELDDQTVRQIARVSLGGEQVRVRLTNAYGEEPLTVGNAQIALRDHDATIVPESAHAVTFAGNTSVVIPPGALVLSDPVPLAVQPLQELVVSLYLPDALTASTVHSLALQTTWLSEPGDHAAATEFPVADTTESTLYLAGIDVLASPESSAVVTLGDSITDGFGATSGAYGSWPDALANRLVVAGLPRSVLNEGIGGNRLLSNSPVEFGQGFGESALTRFDRDVLGQAGVAYLVIFMGINDIGWGAMDPTQLRTSAELIAALNQIIERAHERGLTVIGGTITPYEGAMYYSAAGEATRQEVNTWIRESGAFDHVADFDAAVQDPAHPTRILPEFDPGDALHINDAGYITMAEAINL
ncbi:MAG: SGNH/GDSL hydrolase family protein, partial [Thermomicrobiales bacterium]|nr:SGNH/GDSL hydrolase family protein [Thermomicrobiales bacterium]